MQVSVAGREYYSIGRWSFSKPADMLFCLHHRLIQAHKQERPEIKRLVRVTARDRFTLLGRTCDLTNGNSCERFLFSMGQRR
ncbi:hypothetical protein NDI49_26900 [Trichocoleus sp. ST-U3]